MSASRTEMKQYQEWLILCEQIKSATPVPKENAKEKKARKLVQKDDFAAFAKYYFPHYIDSEFGWFHNAAAKEIRDNKNVFAILEWPREHAKSVFANVMLPLFFYARGEITGMITVSANYDKAVTLLSDLQAEFSSNRRWIEDYGDLAKIGDWREGAFATSDGIGFWAFGRGQSPRGTRKAAKRPNYAVIDDIDDKVIVRNQQRVKETVDWLLEDLYGALSIHGSRVVVAGNRIHKQSILAHLVGDLEPEDPKRSGIFHQKVYAFEHVTTHTMADPTLKTARPAWKERYTREQLLKKMETMGYRAARREYFHEHHEEGHVFKNEWIEYCKPKPISKYKSIVTYTDPSFKDSKKSDYKAVITIGTDGKNIDILDIWLRQASTGAMVSVNYDRWEKYESHSRYYMEANFMQDIILDEFRTEGETRGKQMPIRGDKRKKPDKFSRVENLTPLYERGLVRISEDIRQTNDTQTFLQQLLGFPYGHDDGPDALEGAVYYIQRVRRSGRPTRVRSGKYDYSKSKYS